MGSSAQRRPEARWRRYFRRCRITLLLGIFALVGAVIYLNLVGLPGFIQRPLLGELRARGLDLSIATLRWNFFRGIVAEDVKFGRVTEGADARFTAREAELTLNYRALLEGQFEVTSVGLREGRVVLSVTGTNESERVLEISAIRADLKLLPDDAWSLEDFHARFAGAEFFLSGAITNASAVADWPLFQARGTPGTKPKAKRPIAARLRNFAEVLERIRFTQAPEFRATLWGDARNVESFALHLTVSAPDASTPWGEFGEVTLSARLRPAAPVERPEAELQLHARNVQTPWAEVFHPEITVRMTGVENDTNQVTAIMDAKAAAVTTRWAVVTNGQFHAEWLHSLDNAIPISGRGEFKSDSVGTQWADVRSLTLTTTLATLAVPPPADAALGPWQMLLPYELGWSLRASQFDARKIGAEEIICAGRWAAPQLEVTNLLVRFAEGGLQADAQLDVNTREAFFAMKSNFDAHQFAPLLTDKSQRWLAKFTWEKPPHIAGSGRVVLPPWTNQTPDWRSVGPSLTLAAAVAATNCTYRGIHADWATTHIGYTNLVWRLPDIVAGRSDGTLELAHVADDKTKEFWFGFHSTIPLDAVRSQIPTNAYRALDFFKFGPPPDVRGDVWGRWREPDSIGFTGQVALADFAFRNEAISRVTTTLRYTNRILEFFEPHLERGTQTVHGAGVTIDLNTRHAYVTNIESTIEPALVTRWIGPKTAALMSDYQFHEPPHAFVNGSIALDKGDHANLIFDVNGGPFTWTKFNIPRISGRVYWVEDSLTLSNMVLYAYGGTSAGEARFDLGPTEGTPFTFELGVTNVDLKSLMADLATRTNQLEGRLNGLLVVTNANATNFFTWNGHGHARLEDGLIWAMPIFGLLSKPLDTVMPGLGNTRITEGKASFAITNGVVWSNDLEMRAPATRLQYVGGVDFDGKVNARVRAEPLRDTWVIGPILRLALWPVTKALEYKVTGTLGEPQPEPLHIPKILYKPLLHPFQTLGDLFAPDNNGTNSVPRFTPLEPE